MKMAFKLTGEMKGVAGFISYLKGIQKDLVTEPVLGGLALKAKERILRRTAGGRDFELEGFEPYSKGWKARRAKRGLGTSVVDLKFEGKMLGGIRSKAREETKESRLFFADGSTEGKKAAYHNLTGAGKSKVKRKFFGLAHEDKELLRNILSDHVEKVLSEK